MYLLPLFLVCGCDVCCYWFDTQTFLIAVLFCFDLLLFFLFFFFFFFLPFFFKAETLWIIIFTYFDEFFFHFLKILVAFLLPLSMTLRNSTYWNYVHQWWLKDVFLFFFYLCPLFILYAIVYQLWGFSLFEISK